MTILVDSYSTGLLSYWMAILVDGYSTGWLFYVLTCRKVTKDVCPCFYLKVAPDICGKKPCVLKKVRVVLIFCTSIGVQKKPSPRLSTNLYDQVYFNRRDQFNPSMSFSVTWSDNSRQTS